MSDPYAAILDACEPYLVASPMGAATDPRPAPAGIDFATLNRLDPIRVRSAPFLSLLQRLDELAYGPGGMALPRWAFYDCGEVPGGIFGFAQPVDRLPEDLRDTMAVDAGYRGLVPLSMLVAIPMVEPGAWHAYRLCSINGAVPAEWSGLRLLTLAVGLTVLGVETAYGAAQWRSDDLLEHAGFAPLEVLTAWTPAHTHPATLTWRFEVTPQRVAGALARGPGTAGSVGKVRWVQGDDETALQSIQAELEAGRRFEITGPPRFEDSRVRVPLREVTP